LKRNQKRIGNEKHIITCGAERTYLTSDSDAVAVANIRISDVDLRTEGNNPFLRLDLKYVREGKEVVRRWKNL
jgi:hypothetical protein